MNIHYFILTYQGLSIFENNYNKNLNNEVNLNIIDNGNQTSKKFENFILHKTKKYRMCWRMERRRLKHSKTSKINTGPSQNPRKPSLKL